MIKQIEESKDVTLYKKLLQILGDYVGKFPATGVERLFQTAVDQGIRIMPKDKYALAILDDVLDNTPPAAIQKLLNIRFSDLCVGIKPLYVDGRKHLTAFWSRDNVAHDRVKELIDFVGSGKSGTWSDMDGDSVKLIDMSKEEEEK